LFSDNLIIPQKHTPRNAPALPFFFRSRYT